MATDFHRDLLDEPDFIEEVAFLLTDRSAWMKRVVETIAVASPVRIRRSVSFDFILPSSWPVFGEPHSRAVVPIALMKRGPSLENFDLVDEQGSSVSVVDSGVSSELADRVLRHLIREDAASKQISPDERSVLDALAGDLMSAGLGSNNVWAEFEAAFTGKVSELHARSVAANFAERFGQSFLLCAELQGDTGTRRILKLRHDNESNSSSTDQVKGRPGVVGFVVDLDATHAALGVHAEIIAPPGVELVASYTEVRSAGRPPRALDATGPLGERAHFYLGMLDDTSSARCYSQFRLPLNGLPSSGRSLTAISMIGFAMLAILYRPRAGVAGDALIAIAAALPAAYGAFLAKPTEHPFETDAAQPLRVALFGVVAMSIAVPLLMTAVISDGDARRALFLLAAAGSWQAFRLFVKATAYSFTIGGKARAFFQYMGVALEAAGALCFVEGIEHTSGRLLITGATLSLVGLGLFTLPVDHEAGGGGAVLKNAG